MFLRFEELQLHTLSQAIPVWGLQQISKFVEV